MRVFIKTSTFKSFLLMHEIIFQMHIEIFIARIIGMKKKDF